MFFGFSCSIRLIFRLFYYYYLLLQVSLNSIYSWLVINYFDLGRTIIVEIIAIAKKSFWTVFLVCTKHFTYVIHNSSQDLTTAWRLFVYHLNTKQRLKRSELIWCDTNMFISIIRFDQDFEPILKHRVVTRIL